MRMYSELSISQWLDQILARGAYGFSKESMHLSFPQLSDMAIKSALRRLSRKEKIVSLFKGYYLIIPPQYIAKGVLPPQLYLDAFMKHLQRPYYVALINASAYHGAGHQQPQEYFVMTNFPVLRPTLKKGLKVNYISIKYIPQDLIEKRKTEAGYLNISNAALTACDLIQFEKRIGGINRAATVLVELAEAIKPSDFSAELIKHVPAAALQRLGFLFETVCLQQELADILFENMKKEKESFYRIPLKPSKDARGFTSANRWKVIRNIEIELDE